MKLRDIYRVLVIQRVLIRHGFDDIIFSMSVLRPFRSIRYLFPWNWLGKQKNNRAKRIRLVFEELGPIFIKFGQILSTRRDLLSDDIAEETPRSCAPISWGNGCRYNRESIWPIRGAGISGV